MVIGPVAFPTGNTRRQKSGRTWLFTCGAGCRGFISQLENPPADLAPMVGTDTILEPVGARHMGPDGPFITAVAMARDTWSGVKAHDRQAGRVLAPAQIGGHLRRHK